jgi:cyclophilin family peptidyl-prolyl cis-trans isomerase
MTRLLAAIALLLVPAASAKGGEPGPSPAQLRDAVARALPLIQKGNTGHLEKRSCFACHHQAVPLLALATARSHGLPIDEELFQRNLRAIAAFLDTNRANYRKGQGQGGQVDTAGSALWTLAIGRWQPDDTTAAVSEYLLLRDDKSDHWRATSNRPPSEVSAFTTTYLALRGLDAFATAEQRGRAAERLAKTRKWLESATAKDTEDRVFRLRALKLVRVGDTIVKAAAQELIKTQREDGGWGQAETMAADAYATGTVLVALHEAAGLATDDPVYRRGVKYLLGTQRDDGSWHVVSRSKPFQLYFESGFPHGKDQFISLAASSWAATALALALVLPPSDEPQPVRVLIQTEAGEIEVELDAARAPRTVANFLRYVGGKFYDGGRFHRTVKPDNQPDSKVKIEVIQAGIDPARAKEVFAPIKLERTRDTGLRHQDGTISMARDGPDTATSDFFICIGAQPELDHGGKRNPDGQGFAALGKVIRGMDVVRKVQAAPAKGQELMPTVKILKMTRAVTEGVDGCRRSWRRVP